MKIEANLKNILEFKEQFSNQENFQNYYEEVIKPVIDQYEEIGIEEHDIDLSKGSVILFDNEDEMYKYLHENKFDTDREDHFKLFEDTTETDSYKEFIYIMTDGGAPEEGLSVAYIKS